MVPVAKLNRLRDRLVDARFERGARQHAHVRQHRRRQEAGAKNAKTRQRVRAAVKNLWHS
jgi:hypothetical protein